MEDYYVEQVSTFSFGGGGGGNLPIDPGLDPGLERYVVYGDPVEIDHDMPLGHCQVKWGQQSPYNKFCPTINGHPVYVGCVAVAVAQLMSIYKYPNSYNGYTFNWNLMNQYVNTSCSQQDNAIAVDQIARLMQQLGLSQNLAMQYEIIAPGNGSGAYARDIPQTLSNFGYSNGGSLVDYDTDDVVDELLAGYPILISGNDGDSGHQWLGHGLKEYEQIAYIYNGYNMLVSTIDVEFFYILCNWGWDGDYDGYYLSETFNINEGPAYPESCSTRSSIVDYYYRYNLKVVKNIRK